MSTKTFTEAELLALLDEAHHPTVLKWLARGDGAAVYQNQDFNSANFGHMQFVSFGSPAAQLETDTPPQKLPDIGGAINWRYQLEGTCRRSHQAGGQDVVL